MLILAHRVCELSGNTKNVSMLQFQEALFHVMKFTKTPDFSAEITVSTIILDSTPALTLPTYRTLQEFVANCLQVVGTEAQAHVRK